MTLLGVLFAFQVSARALECTGADPCLACRDCSTCHYCSPKNPRGGSCGKLRNQTAAEREKAARKREKAGR